MWVPATELAKAPGHPFYQRLNRVLDKHGFDDFVEAECTAFYAPSRGRPGLAPGIYFRLLLVGYFEGLSSERGIAWRAADSLALRGFLGLNLSESPPDHSTISRTRRLIDVATHEKRRQQMGQEGRDRFTDQFRHENMTARIRQLYSRLLRNQ